MGLNANAKRELTDIAWQSIRFGVKSHRMLTVHPALTDELNQPGASFVTLHKAGQLRGCIGSLEAQQSLIRDVAQNAFSAAFNDPRFTPLEAEELPALTLQISILTAPESIQFKSEVDLLRQLVPGEDGLVLEDQGHRGTFLPQVWEQLPQPSLFLSQLKRKAGLPANHWSDSLRVQRYRVEKF